MRPFLILTILSLALFVPDEAVRADIIFFDNRADFDATTSAQAIIDFEGIAPDGNGVAFPSGVLTLSGVTFTTTVTAGPPGTGDFVVVGKGAFSAFGFPSSALVAQQNNLDPDILATLPNLSLAFGVDFGSFPAEMEATFLLSTGDTFTRTTSSGSSFVGLLSTDPFTSVKISTPPSNSGSTALIIDNFTFGNGVASVPEPASGVLMVIGVGAALGFFWRRTCRVWHRFPIA
ncbi:MAG: PEP-CTERM sorting domain-containing protein [Gemmataceae bacterium]